MASADDRPLQPDVTQPPPSPVSEAQQVPDVEIDSEKSGKAAPNVTQDEKNEEPLSKPSSTKAKAPDIKEEGKEDAAKAEVVKIPDSCLDDLSEGLLNALLPHFKKHEESLSELTRNQVLMIETLQQENRKFAENKMVDDLSKMMLEAKHYQSKLTTIKKDMTSLHEKSTKLKRRALKLQQQKMKDNLEKEQQRERDIEEDRKLTAKRPMPSSSKTDPHRETGEKEDREKKKQKQKMIKEMNEGL